MMNANVLTQAQKVKLLQGRDMWYTNAFEKQGIFSICLSDGPAGLCQKAAAAKGVTIASAVHATAFCVPVAMSCSWDRALIERVGEAIGKECRHYGTQVLLAPGMNLKRNPLCGRNFEYYSEDPVQSGQIATSFVRGVQSTGVGVSLKHFALNGREHNRFYGNSVADERAMREVWLRGFEMAVKEAKPYTVMAAYNKVNGTHAAQSSALLEDILRRDWGFDGVVMSDWGGIANRPAALLAGCDLEMPGQVAARQRQLRRLARKDEGIARAVDTSAQRVLTLVERCTQNLPDVGKVDFAAHAALAEQVACRSAVLLQNHGVLPLGAQSNVFAAGPFFVQMRYQGAGSSQVNPAEVDSPAQALEKRGIACAKSPEAADVILYFGGLTDLEECEGEDRAHMRLPEDQLAELRVLLSHGKPVVLVLYSGCVVEIPEGLAAVLLMHLPGMRGGEASVALLFGEQNPSGRLSETWLTDSEQSYCAAQFKSDSMHDVYAESVYVGYRYYDAYPERVRYPFGHGLSYTEFAYSDLEVQVADGKVIAHVSVTNTGKRDGAEVVQLYVQNAPCEVFRPKKELKAFAKVFLAAGQTQRVSLEFACKDLSYWHIGKHDWVLPDGEYEILIAKDAQHTELAQAVHVDGAHASCPYSQEVVQAYATPASDEAAFAALYGELPAEPDRLPLSVESPFRDYRKTLLGRVLWKVIACVLDGNVKKARGKAHTKDGLLKLKNAYFIRCMMPGASMRTVASSSSGRLPMGAARAVAFVCRGKKRG